MLPPVLGNPDYVTDKDYFQTTTGTTHDYKAHGGTLGNMLFKKAPGSWKVHYVEDNIGKVYYQTSLLQKQKGQISEWAFINSEVAYRDNFPNKDTKGMDPSVHVGMLRCLY